MFNLIQSAQNNERNEEYKFYLTGDLLQMVTQEEFLSARGFDIRQNDVYPCLKEKDKKAALQLIWDNKVDGWWHYDNAYADLGICTLKEFGKALHSHNNP